MQITHREFAGEINQGVSKSAIRFSAEKTFIDNVNKPAQLATEDEAYCPPTPVPKKSILKDPYSMDTKSKQVIIQNRISVFSEIDKT